MEDIGLKIKKICKEHGYKQENIAKTMNISQGTLSEKLSNGNDIKYSLILEISEITNIPIIDIISYPDKYVLAINGCQKCNEKDKIIENLNELLELYKQKKGKL